MAKYAENTSVSTERSKAEIERILAKHGANEFMYATRDGAAAIMFRLDGKHVRFILPMPDKASREFTHTPGRGNRRSDEQAYQAWEQACRQKWRALALVIKAKLEAIEAGITVFEDEFLAHIVLPNNQTVSEFIGPQVEHAYLTGNMPPMLPFFGD